MNAIFLARFFHDTYEMLAPVFGYETRPDTKKFDPESKNGKLMIAVAGEVIAKPFAASIRLDKADVLRGRVCRLVCFGVSDDDLPQVYELCSRLERQALDRAAKELELCMKENP